MPGIPLADTRRARPLRCSSNTEKEAAEMFIQVIQGKVADAEGLRAAMDRWGRDLQPGATGWLGTTGGSPTTARSWPP